MQNCSREVYNALTGRKRTASEALPYTHNGKSKTRKIPFPTNHSAKAKDKEEQKMKAKKILSVLMAIGVCGSAAPFSGKCRPDGLTEALKSYVEANEVKATEFSDILTKKLDDYIRENGCSISIDDILDYIASNKPSEKPYPDEPNEPTSRQLRTCPQHG